MNETLKQALLVVFYVFAFGLICKSDEILNVVKGGLGNILLCSGIILGICVFFPLNIDIRDKIICLFWAGALFITGAVMHKCGFIMSVIAVSAYLFIVTLYFSPLIEASIFKPLIASSIIIFYVGLTLMCMAQKISFLSILNKPTEKPYVVEPCMDQVRWNLWAYKIHKKERGEIGETGHYFRIATVTGTEVEANSMITNIMQKWEADNPDMMLLVNYNLIYDEKIRGKN